MYLLCWWKKKKSVADVLLFFSEVMRPRLNSGKKDEKYFSLFLQDVT